jgi:predicted HNH restriction endonuclease
MTESISERDLILPALFCIDEAGEISTTELTNCLRAMLNPQGEDLEILTDRNDDKFSQKVRNLRSHKTLERKELVKYANRGRQGYWQITAKGKKVLEANRYLLEYLYKQAFEYELQKEAFSKIADAIQIGDDTPDLLDETITEQNIAILEGKNRVVKQKIYERSAKLREYAIKYYTVEGRIYCQVCGFDFGKFYGSHGEGFIEIHHLKPIFTYGDEDV